MCETEVKFGSKNTPVIRVGILHEILHEIRHGFRTVSVQEPVPVPAPEWLDSWSNPETILAEFRQGKNVPDPVLEHAGSGIKIAIGC